VLKETIQKIDKTYYPSGYQVAIPIGDGAAQNQPFHFYCQVVPKYKQGQGSVGTVGLIRENFGDPNVVKDAEKLNKTLQPNSDKIIAEKGKLIAKIHSDVGYNELGCLAISTKNYLPNEINAIDQGTVLLHCIPPIVSQPRLFSWTDFPYCISV